MDRARLKLAGWASIISAIITIPTFGLLMCLEGLSDIKSKIIKIALLIIDFGLFVYIYLSFKMLLNCQFRFYKVNFWIWILIYSSIAILIFSVLSLASSIIEKMYNTISLSISIIFGIVYIIFAIKILNLPNTLFGLLKPFSYTSVINGVVSIIIGIYHLIIILVPKNILNKIKIYFSGEKVFILVLIYLFTDILIKTFLGIIFFKTEKSFLDK